MRDGVLAAASRVRDPGRETVDVGPGLVTRGGKLTQSRQRPRPARVQLDVQDLAVPERDEVRVVDLERDPSAPSSATEPEDDHDAIARINDLLRLCAKALDDRGLSFEEALHTRQAPDGSLQCT